MQFWRVTVVYIGAVIGSGLHRRGGIALFTIPITRSRNFYAGFLLVSGGIPTFQASMLVVEPKLCPACLAITFVSAAYFIATLKVLTMSELLGFASPVWVSAAFIISNGLLLFRHTLVLGGIISVTKPAEVTVPRVIGTPFSKFVASTPSPQPGVLYVVSQEHCGACITAEQELNRMKIEWRKVPICTILKNSGCFDGQQLSFPTPMLLICDQSGRIIFQRNGWVASPPQLEDLKDQIQIAQRRGRPMK